MALYLPYLGVFLGLWYPCRVLLKKPLKGQIRGFCKFLAEIAFWSYNSSDRVEYRGLVYAKFM